LSALDAVETVGEQFVVVRGPLGAQPRHGHWRSQRARSNVR
jgi:hypothetical protein